MKQPVNLKHRLLVSTSWNGFAIVARQLISLVSMIVIARLLSPQEYGIAAASMLVIELAGVFSAIGALEYILTRKTINDNQINTAWTLQLLVRLICSSLVFLFSAQIAALLRIPELELVLKITAAIPLLLGLQNPGLFLTKRNLKYGAVSALDVGSRLIGLIVGVVIAIKYQTYWALIASAITATFIFTIASYSIDTKRPTLSIKDWRNMLYFARWNLPIGIVGHYKGKIDNYLVARYFGAIEIGIYSLSKRLATLPHEILATTLQTIVLTALGGTQSRKQNAVKNLPIIMICTLSVVLPVSAGLCQLADLLVITIFGDQWVRTIPLIQILSILSVTFAATASIQPVLIATERIHVAFYIDLATTLLVIVSMAAGVVYADDLVEYASLRVLVAFVVLIFLFAVLHIVVKTRVLSILYGLVPAITATIVMFIVIENLRHFDAFSGPTVLLTAYTLVAMLCYFTVFGVIVLLMKKNSIEISLLSELIETGLKAMRRKVFGKLFDLPERR